MLSAIYFLAIACNIGFILSNSRWNYARFLDYASDRIFLQKVGGGYIFIHRLLLEHFAQSNQVSKVLVPVTPRQTSQSAVQANTRTNIRSSNNSNTLPKPSNPVPNHLECAWRQLKNIF
ncbi:MAG: hypothetical protein QNJ55_35140 [Xenococcus sp. MO_188.B8]|nr:hypothetical protein [Xenococcus sp. MO_188.B8]